MHSLALLAAFNFVLEDSGTQSASGGYSMEKNLQLQFKISLPDVSLSFAAKTRQQCEIERERERDLI